MGLYGREYIGGPVSYEQGLEIEKEAMKLTRGDGARGDDLRLPARRGSLFAPVVDVMVAHAGWTVGGMAGAPPTASVEEAAKAVNQQVAAGKETGADIIFFGHGGPFSGPEDTQALYELTEVVGFVGASSIERIPVERAVKETVEAFKVRPLENEGGLIDASLGYGSRRRCRNVHPQAARWEARDRRIRRRPRRGFPGVEWRTGDILDTEGLAKAADGCDGMIHLAGIPIYNPDRVLDIGRINIYGMQSAIEAAVQAPG